MKGNLGHGGKFSLQPIINTIVLPILAALATALAGWAMTKIATLAHLSAQSALRTFLEQVIDNGIAWAVQKLGSLPAGYTTVQVNNSIVSSALTYVTTAAPGILKSLGLDLTTPAGQKQLENSWILARLGASPTAQSTPGVATSTTPAPVTTPAAKTA